MKAKYSYKILDQKPQKIFTLEEIKNYIRITGDNDDDLLKEMLDSAIETAENFIKYSITEKIVEVTSYNINYVNLPLVPVIKIMEVKADGNVLSGEYTKISQDRLEIISGTIYKELIVTYLSGYVDYHKIPAGIKQAIMLHTAQIYDNRGNINIFGNQIYEIYKPYRKMVI